MARNALGQARSSASARTARTYPRNPGGGIYIKGAKSIEASTGDTARTTSGWIEGQKYGWYAQNVATAWSAEFDTAVARTGLKTVKLSTTDITGKTYAMNNPNDYSAAGMYKHCVHIKPSTAYVFSCWIKTTNVTINNDVLWIEQYDSAAGLGSSAGAYMTGTNDWTLKTVSFTSDADACYLMIYLQASRAGNVSDVWFDVNSMTLDATAITRNSVA